jgi:TolB-like protein/Flp pilus assembly protein TadD
MLASPVRSGSQIRFGVFEIDLEAGELRKKGYRLRIQQQPFQLLALLLERSNEVVTREEIQQKIWGNDTFVDFDHGVNRAINKIRDVLGDSADNPRFIETLSKRGYRFIAPVYRDAHSHGDDKKMLVVLPFTNLSIDTDQDYFSDGLTEEMITHLSRLNPERLGVIARTSAMRFKNTAKDIRAIGQELGVEYALEGSIRRSGNRVRITAQLIQVKDQTHLWAESYDRALEDVLAIQADVAERIASSLAFELVPDLRARTPRVIGSNTEVYELNLHGRYYLNQRIESGYRKAIQYFNEAIKKDPTYAPAFAGLADAYSVIGFYGAIPPALALEKAKVAARTAVQFDEKLAEAHTSLGYAILQYDWDWPTAEAEHKRAIELNPSWHAYDWYGFNLVQVGRFNDAAIALEQARRMDPLSLVVGGHIGWMHYFRREFERSALQLEKVVALDPLFPLARYFLGLTYAQLGNFKRAIDHLQAAASNSEEHPGALSALAYTLGACGRKEEGEQVLQRLCKVKEQRHVLAYFMAFAVSTLREREETYKWLDQAYEERSGWPLYLHFEPAFDNLRSDLRFIELLSRISPFMPRSPLLNSNAPAARGGDLSS